MRKKTKLSYIYIQRTLGLAYFPHFRVKHCFQKMWLCHAQHDMGPEHHVEFQEKLNSQFKENFQTEGRTELIDMYYSSGHGQGSYKRISQLRSFAEDNEKKIQHTT